MPVRAVVSLLRVAEDTPENLPRDENIYGKTGREWLLPDAPEVIRFAAEKVGIMAATPGIAGIVLRDSVPPGYRGENTDEAEDRVWTGEIGGQLVGTGGRLGYTLSHRRAYLQETGKDPADIMEAPNEIGMWESADTIQTWHAWTRKRLTPLWHAVQEATKNKTLLIEGMATFGEARSILPTSIGDIHDLG